MSFRITANRVYYGFKTTIGLVVTIAVKYIQLNKLIAENISNNHVGKYHLPLSQSEYTCEYNNKAALFLLVHEKLSDVSAPVFRL